MALVLFPWTHHHALLSQAVPTAIVDHLQSANTAGDSLVPERLGTRLGGDSLIPERLGTRLGGDSLVPERLGTTLGGGRPGRSGHVQ